MEEGPAAGAREAAVVAGKVDLMDTDMVTVMAMVMDHPEGLGPRECTSNLWRREPGQWPCTTPSPCARTVSLSTGPCSFSVRITL